MAGEESHAATPTESSLDVTSRARVARRHRRVALACYSYRLQAHSDVTCSSTT
jgi:hypothetical protein